MILKDNANLIDVYKESGAHYRHLENQRNLYLGFYFTFLPTSFALVSTTFKGSQVENFLISMIEFTVLLNLVIGLYIISAIKKIGFALKMHSKVIETLGDKILKENNLDYNKITEPFNRKNPIYNSGFLNTHRSVLMILIFISVILDGCLGGLITFDFISRTPSSVLLSILLGLIWLLIIMLQVMVFRVRIHPKENTQ